MEASRVEERGGYLDFSRLTPGELVGMVAALVLLGSLWLPWFTTSGNPNSVIGEQPDLVIGPNDSATAFQTFPILRWLLISACAAPFILSWIVARRHKLTWRPGEVTMIVGITTLVLILCNGIILGKPEPGIEIGLDFGYFVAILACIGMTVAGYLRQAIYTDARKPPGVL
jgi:hypothetical protein